MKQRKKNKIHVYCLACTAIVLACVFSGCGSAPAETMPEETEEQVTAAPSTVFQTESTEAGPKEKLYLTVSRLVLSYPGKTENIYCGTAPLKNISWTSSDPEVISVENGVVTAMAAGEAEITAEMGDTSVQCTVSCLAESPEAFERLDNSILSEPVRDPPDPKEGKCDYYDDAGFVGDSVTYQLLYTPGREERIGKPVAMFRRSATVKGFTDYYWNLTFRGQERKLEDAVAESGVKKLFFMLGANDMGYVSVEDTMANWDTLIGRILEKSPEVEIYIESILPSATGDRYRNGKNEKIAQYNAALKDFAEEKGLHYFELGAYFEDSLGRLARGYSSDGDVHITEKAVYKWSDILRLFAQRQQEA